MESSYKYGRTNRVHRALHSPCHLAILLITVMLVEEVSSQACLVGQKQCLSGSPTCILLSERCDGVKNCQDGSDEFYCDSANISYALIWSSTQWASNFGHKFVLYGDPDAYRGQIELNQTFFGSVAALTVSKTTPDNNFQSLETDVAAFGFYFSDGKSQYVGLSDIAVSYNDYLINTIPASDSVTGLSVDWVSGLLYWSDATYKRIAVMSRNTWTTWAPVVEDGLTSPQDVVVYPQESFVFWSDVGNVSKIERLDLTNGVREVIVSNADLQQPTTLVIDFVNERLLFLDSKASRIGSVLLDGSNLTFWSMALFSSISSFTLFKGYICLGDNKLSTSYVYNFTHKTFVGSISNSGENGIIDITVYEKAKQPTVASPCKSNNGDCEHFCITINATSRTCKCAMGYFLHANGTSCDTQVFSDNFLLVADFWQLNIFQVGITTGQVRASSKIPPFLPTAMDYDPQTTSIYVFDNDTSAIIRVTISNQTNSQILQTQGASVLGIAIDTVGRLLYFIDGSKNEIVEMTISGVISNRTVLSEPNSKPKAIALDVYKRFIFWSNCYQPSSSSIEQADITNISNHHSVVSGLSACPSAIAVDFLNQLIYWGDTAGGIRRVGYDGTGQSLVYRSTSTTVAYAGLALDETSLYISDTHQRAILRLNRTTLQVSRLTALHFVQPQGIVLYSSTTPTGSPRQSTTTTTSSSTTATTTTTTATTTTTTDSSTKIIIACVVSISVVLILVIIIIIVVKKRRRNGSKTSDNSSVYDQIDDQQLKTFENGIQNEASNQHEGLQNDYLHLPCQRESLSEDYLHLEGLRSSLPNDYLNLPGRRENLPDDGYLCLKTDVPSTLPGQMIGSVGMENESPTTHVPSTESDAYI